MTNGEVVAARDKVQGAFQPLVTAFEEMLAMGRSGTEEPTGPEALLGTMGYEGRRRLEEFLHRANDAVNILLMLTDEGIAAAADRAAAEGRVQIVGADGEVSDVGQGQ